MTKKLQKVLAYKVKEDAYDGAELRPYQGRPGAMDAFSKPSLINGERQEHKQIVYMTSAISTPFYNA